VATRGEVFRYGQRDRIDWPERAFASEGVSGKRPIRVHAKIHRCRRSNELCGRKRRRRSALFGGNATKAGLAQLDAFLKNPDVIALIGLGSQEEGREGEQPLHRACAALNQKAIEQLLDAGADVNAQDAQGWTALRHLLRKTGAKAQAKSLPAVKALIERGADPSIRDAKGRTPAQSAAAKASLGALSELLQLRPEDIAGEATGCLWRKAST